MFKRMIMLAALASCCAVSALAADLPLKAPPAASGVAAIFKGYPYGTSGLFVGIFTEGGAGAVNGATAPGVASASLTSTQAGVGATIGYSWGWKNSPVAFSAEGDFGWTNFNGTNAGLSMSGPAAFEQRIVAFTPLATMLSMLPNGPNFGTVPPFQPLQPGLFASNLQMGLFAGIRENDISLNFPGLTSNREWRVAPVVGLMAMEQLSNGTALRSWIKTVFPDKGVCAGPVKNACGGLGQQYLAGAGIYF